MGHGLGGVEAFARVKSSLGDSDVGGGGETLVAVFLLICHFVAQCVATVA